MKNLIRIMLGTALLTVCLTFTNYAQIREGKTLFSGQVGYNFLSNEATGNSMDGYAFALFIEFLATSDFSFGFGIGTVRAQDEFVKDNLASVSDFSSWPLVLTLKYIFNSNSNAYPYVGFNIGWHYTEGATVTSTPQATPALLFTRNGVAISVPVGLMYFVSKNVYLYGNVAGTWLDNTPFKNNLNFAFNLGVGTAFN